MATNHHHHPPCHCLPTPSTTITCYCTICCTTNTLYPPPPQPDPQLHSISSHHAPPQNHHYQHAPPQHHDTQPYNHPPLQPHHSFQNYSPNEPTQQNPTVSSLIHRIAALESSLRRRKPPSPPPSLRHAAARTIQTHFRSFLVRRSVTLRHLKDLARIKSALNHLKSCVSGNTQFDHHTLSRKSMSLLIKLDSIQGSDPMIRDGKRSISRELTRFMELIDEICTERQVITVKNVRFSKNSKKSVNLHPEISIKASSSRVFGYNNERKFPETLKSQRKSDNEVDESPQTRTGDLMKSEGKSEPKVKKNVTFDEKGNVYRLIKINRNADSGSSDGSESCNDEEEEEIVEEVEEIGVSVSSKETEDDESSEMSENEMDPRKKLGTRSYHPTRKNQNQHDEQEEDDDEGNDDDSFVFSAPLPAKMEYRVDSASKKQPAKH